MLKKDINLYLQNYYIMDTIYYVITESSVYIDPKVRFDSELDHLSITDKKRELFLTNRFKDLSTKRVFINGTAVLSTSITQLGEVIDVKTQIIKNFDNYINMEDEEDEEDENTDLENTDLEENENEE